MGAALPAILAAAQRQAAFLAHFRTAGATAADAAIPLPDPAASVGRRQVASWVRAGVLRPTPDGRYWLDEARYQEQQTEVARGALGVVAGLVIGMVLLLAGVAVAVWLTRRGSP